MTPFSPSMFVRYLVSVAAFIVLPIGIAAEPIRVDLGVPTGRSDTGTPGWREWQVPEARETSQKFGDVQVTLRVAEDRATVRGCWHKAGIATGATLSTDGVIAETNATTACLELELVGLPAGSHSLTTYHNAVEKPLRGPMTMEKDGQPLGRSVTATYRVDDDIDAATAHVEFEVEPNEAVIFRFSAAGDSGLSAVVLNGFEIDAGNPRRKAQKPLPADGDWHADADAGDLHLQWRAASSTVMQRVYLASAKVRDEARRQVSKAGDDGEGFVGEVTSPSLVLRNIDRNSRLYYCWRVDSIDSDGTVTRGDIWSFRCRQPAFPSAEGYGRFAIGGRGGRVIKVTNLEDAGPGSFRAAVEAEGPRTVVFDIGGRIELQSRLIIRNSFLTIAGQTAPGLGICLSNFNLGMLGAHDVIIRHLRVRPGDTAGMTLDGMGMASCDHCIIDHCSISWSQDEAFSSRSARNITLQRTLISEALNIAGHKKYEKGSAHGFAASIGGDIGSFHHNLLAHCAGRNWSLAGGLNQASRHTGRLDIRNNVVYNWQYRTTDGGARQVVFENNFYKPGPATNVWHVLKPERNNIQGFGPQDYYAAGNVMAGRYDQTKDPRAGIVVPQEEALDDFFYPTPFFPSFVSTESAEDAFKTVVSDVGCNQPALDAHDLRVIKETISGTTTYTGGISGLPGLPDSQEDVGGWDAYPSSVRDPQWDSDDDGLPDWWESIHGLDIHSPPGDFSDCHADLDGNGYSNLEEYLRQMGEPHVFCAGGDPVVLDLSRYARGFTDAPTFSVVSQSNGRVDVSTHGRKATFTPPADGPAIEHMDFEVRDREGSRHAWRVWIFVMPAPSSDG